MEIKNVFDWLREQMEKLACWSDDYKNVYIDRVDVLDLINEAEAKWESECCEWEFFKPSNSLYEKHGDFRTGDELAKWNVCPYCGKPIKISEVE